MQLLPRFEPSTACASDSGYTLLEMLVALVIAGLASAAIGNAITGTFARNSQQTTLARLDRMMAQARTTATRERRVVSIMLAENSRTLAVPELALSYDLPSDVAVTFTGVEAGGPGSSMTALYFLADGSTTGARIAVTARGTTIDRTIGWVSGRVDDRGAP
ncbi:general secretion pathway protein H [Kaistia hirudinis]|uniref:General secretion pathway protein H n=1 Tax=Kaistia hirudinis TaxID=1293440 RepID=A0A840ALY3_9HYPH|nr:prepilin-type N-terminal cleavage/methylation domain-containing protein [Kaistia hirudinis]MBB3930037.1 general secretion pathway protein H [Kaistia hirudinis]